MRRCCVFVVALAALAQDPLPAIREDVNLVPVTFGATDGNGSGQIPLDGCDSPGDIEASLVSLRRPTGFLPEL